MEEPKEEIEAIKQEFKDAGLNVPTGNYKDPEKLRGKLDAALAERDAPAGPVWKPSEEGGRVPEFSSQPQPQTEPENDTRQQPSPPAKISETQEINQHLDFLFLMTDNPVTQSIIGNLRKRLSSEMARES